MIFWFLNVKGLPSVYYDVSIVIDVRLLQIFNFSANITKASPKWCGDAFISINNHLSLYRQLICIRYAARFDRDKVDAIIQAVYIQLCACTCCIDI